MATKGQSVAQYWYEENKPRESLQSRLPYIESKGESALPDQVTCQSRIVIRSGVRGGQGAKGRHRKVKEIVTV